MEMRAAYRQHAVDCGLDMTGCDAIELDHEYCAAGMVVAHTICDPEHQDYLVRPGTVLTRRMIEWLMSFGVDYVTVMV
mgnify:CR=1 FL=1